MARKMLLALGIAAREGFALRTVRGEIRPVMAWDNVPMLPHVMRQGSDDHPNKELQARCAAMIA